MRLLTAALVLLAVPLGAAPKGKPDAPTFTGEFGIEQESPVVYGDLGEEGRPVIWLVFADEETESRLLARIGAGDRVTITGRPMRGGAFRYWIVHDLKLSD